MKHLKLFEYFESKFKEIVDDPEIVSEPWTIDDVNKIKKIVKDNGDKYSPGGRYVENPIVGKNRRFEVNISEKTPIDLEIRYYFPFPCMSGNFERSSLTLIRKFEDEWFKYTPPYRDKNVSYLVDGLDGIEEIIKEMFP